MKVELSSLRALTVSLSALNAVLLAGLVSVLLAGTHSATLLNTPAQSVSVPAFGLVIPERRNDVGLLASKALFHESRRFYVRPVESEQAQAPPRPDYRLSGTFAMPGRPALAILASSATNTVRKVKAGDDLDGWVVEAVEQRRVLLRSGVEAVELVLAANTTRPNLTAVSSPPSPSVQPASAPAKGHSAVITDEVRLHLTAPMSNASSSREGSSNATLMSSGATLHR